MMPVVALVGRPNVGKSTLFNRLTRRRDALVADIPGLTRDRRYSEADIDGVTVTLVDTGGLFGDEVLAESLKAQTLRAVVEADLVLLLLDARSGISALDEDVITELRRRGAHIVGVLNKIDGLDIETAAAEFAALGLGELERVSASHGHGVAQLRERILGELGLTPPVLAVESADDVWPDEPAPDLEEFDVSPVASAEDGPIRVAIIGRPNVGKSTLINRLLGDERQVVADMPGTTMDAIDIPFERDGVRYVLIDTAGVRRKGRVDNVAEKFSVVKALEAMTRAHVAILVIDAREGVVEQDLHVLQHATKAGAGLIIAANKWDGLDTDARDHALTTIDRRLDFIPWAEVRRISALHGTGVGKLWELVRAVHRTARFDVSTALLNRVLQGLVTAHPPPTVRGRAIKLKMVSRQGGHPPTIVVHGNQVESVPASYVRYLENGFRQALKLAGTPIRILLRAPDNPFAGRRNILTPRQQRRRERVRRFGK
ncbi:MAG: ribosome biogenesis GTPase Der [Pseudomonadales bacterium]